MQGVDSNLIIGFEACAFGLIYLILSYAGSIACELSLGLESGGYSLAAVHGLLITVASLLAEHSSRHMGFSGGSPRLEHRLSGCSTQVQLLQGTWDLPGPGIEPVFPALQWLLNLWTTGEVPKPVFLSTVLSAI